MEIDRPPGREVILYSSCRAQRSQGCTVALYVVQRNTGQIHQVEPLDDPEAQHFYYSQASSQQRDFTRFFEAERLKNWVRVAKTVPEPFCDARRLWYSRFHRFSALQGWRHGVRSRSFGGTSSSPPKNGRVHLGNRPAGRFFAYAICPRGKHCPLIYQLASRIVHWAIHPE
jgi:hypothetical protein